MTVKSRLDRSPSKRVTFSRIPSTRIRPELLNIGEYCSIIDGDPCDPDCHMAGICMHLPGKLRDLAPLIDAVWDGSSTTISTLRIIVSHGEVGNNRRQFVMDYTKAKFWDIIDHAVIAAAVFTNVMLEIRRMLNNTECMLIVENGYPTDEAQMKIKMMRDLKKFSTPHFAKAMMSLYAPEVAQSEKASVSPPPSAAAEQRTTRGVFTSCFPFFGRPRRSAYQWELK